MIRQLLIVVGAAASSAGLVAVVTWPGEAQQHAVQNTAYVLEKSTPPLFDSSYTAGLRIIHVPQRGGAMPNGAHGAAPSYSEEVDVDVPPSPKARRHATPQPRRVLPPPGTSKRTVLTAPDALHDGPSPVRPLPRWRDIENVTPSRPGNPAVRSDAVVAPNPAAPAVDDSVSLPTD